MLRVGAGAVADMEALLFLPVQIDEVEAAMGLMKPEIGDADDILAPDHVARLVQLALGDLEKLAVARISGHWLREHTARQGHTSAQRDAGAKPGLDQVATLHIGYVL